jgi:hypothetical protein
MSQDFENVPFSGNERNDKKTKARTYLYGAIAIMFIVLLLSWFFNNRRINHDLLRQLAQKEQKFVKYKTDNDKIVVTQEQLILTANKENMRLVKTINKFKEIQGQVKVQTITQLKEIKVPYKVEVVKYIDTSTPNSLQTFIKTPLPFEQKDKHYNIAGRVESDGVFIDSLNIPNELTITTGKVKGGLFKDDKYIIEVVSNNPNVDISKVNNTQFKPKTRFYKKWWFGFGLGAITTLFIIK